MKNITGISIQLHTLEPILATSFLGDPNSDVSYPYIPGSMIRGAVISRYLRYHQLSELDLNDAKVKGLFFDPTQALYLNAYLLSQEGKRTLPVPLSWFKDKDAKLPESDETSSMQIYDRAVEYNLPDDYDNITLKGLEQNFCTVKGQSVVLYSEKRRINIHNFRNRKKGKGTKDEGEIFRYDAIDSGQKFKAFILCQNTDLLETLQKLLPESTNIWFGGSQSAGYGKTKIEKVELLADDWCEVEIPSNQRVNNERLIITLLSDTILRDECGQTVADGNLIKPALEEIVGELPSPESVVMYANSSLIGGFNRKWGLPLPQVPALLAGSVVVFEGITLNTAQIQRLEYYGIGERRNEGFGRVALNWLKEEKLQARASEKKNKEQPILEKSSPSRPLANLMAERILRQRLEQKLIKKLGETDTAIETLDNISNSQLSRLWLAAREGLKREDGADASLEPVREFLKQDNLTKNAYEQFKNTRMKNNDFLLYKISTWLESPDCWITNKRHLEVTITDDLKQGLNDDIGKKLVIQYTLKLIMAVAKRATKEKD